MTITVVGKQNTKATYKILESNFGRLQKRDEPDSITIREPKQHGERRFEIYFDANPYLLIGWHKPTVPSRDDYVADVVEGILTGGKTSRLYKSIVLEKKIAISVDAWNGSPGARYDNLFVISAAPKFPHTTKEVEKAIYDEIDKLREDATEEEIERVINRIESSMIFRLDSNSGISYLLNYYQTVFEDWKYFIDYLDVMKTIDVKDVKLFINRYFTKENRTVGDLVNRKKKSESK